MKWLILSILTVTLYMSDGTQQVFTGDYQLNKTAQVQETYTESVGVAKDKPAFESMGKAWGRATMETVYPVSQYYIVSKDGYAEFISPVSSVTQADVP